MKLPIDPIDPRSVDALLHDCPECRAALARGETPIILTGEDLIAMMPRPVRRRIEREQARAARRAARTR